MEIDDVKIDFLGHSGFLIEYNKKKIAIDPYNVSDNLDKVDFILITHSHYDHCSIKDIGKLSRQGTVILTPADSQSKITRIEGIEMQIVEIGDEISFGNIKIEAVPSYNIEKDFHPKKDGFLGYLIKVEGVIIYHAGDCDKMPEMQNLTGYGKHANKFVVLLPVSGKYVMDADEAAEVAGLLNPYLAIPMHYGAGVVGDLKDAERFVKICTENGVKAQVITKI